MPYDFESKRLSILVAGVPPQLITKGAYAQVLDVATTAEVGGQVMPLTQARAQLDEQFAQLSGEGFRVLAVATRSLPDRTTVTVADEADLTVRGLLAFADPPKTGAPEAIATLAVLGVSVRLVTGDNRLAARHIAGTVGLPPDDVLIGDAIDALDDETLAHRAAEVAVFAEVEPLHKERLVRALRASG